MNLNWRHFRSLLFLYVLLSVIYTLMRLAFIGYNVTDFDTPTQYTFIKTIANGSRFDLSAILLTNILFTILWLLPLGKWWSSKYYQQTLKLVFVVVNSFFILINVIDIVYYPFVKKRMQKDVFLFFTGDKGDEAYTLLPAFLQQYWYMWLFMVGLFFLIFKFYNIITNKIKHVTLRFSWPYLGIFLMLIGLELIGIRGGLQLRPLAVIDASQGTSIQNIPFVLNSPFSLLRTWGKKSLDEKHFFDESQFNHCENPLKYIQSTKDPKDNKPNVVIIMVESLSKEYLSWYKGTGNTPFLDSLIGSSYVFNNGFANARESVQGVPAVLASIPAWMDEAFIFSKYGSNHFNSIASLTKPFGYKSYFFHGAARGTMGFYSFTSLAGFDGYYSKEDYPDQRHFDGSWGIWDHYFLPFMVDKLSSFSQPFVAGLLTLNTHHPFKTPPDFHVKHPNEQYPILNSLQYADACLRTFFKEAARQSWFQNTLFVITADHTGPKTVDVRSALDDYRIPIIFYRPDNSLIGSTDTILSQIDLMPTLISMMGLSTEVFSFGQNALDDQCLHYHIDYKSGIYQYADNQYCLHFDGTKTIGVFDWQKDQLLTHNLMNNPELSSVIWNIETCIKKNIQSYNHAMIHNKMIPDAKK